MLITKHHNNNKRLEAEEQEEEITNIYKIIMHKHIIWFRSFFSLKHFNSSSNNSNLLFNQTWSQCLMKPTTHNHHPLLHCNHNPICHIAQWFKHNPSQSAQMDSQLESELAQDSLEPDRLILYRTFSIMYCQVHHSTLASKLTYKLITTATKSQIL